MGGVPAGRDRGSDRKAPPLAGAMEKDSSTFQYRRMLNRILASRITCVGTTHFPCSLFTNLLVPAWRPSLNKHGLPQISDTTQLRQAHNYMFIIVVWSLGLLKNFFQHAPSVEFELRSLVGRMSGMYDYIQLRAWQINAQCF